MADTKISALTELAVEPASTDELAINDGGTSKKITVANLMLASGGLTFAKVVKNADETVTSSTTLQDDDQLTFTPNISKTYNVSIFVFMDSGVTPDIKFALSIPTGATAIELAEVWAPNDSRVTTNWTSSRMLVGAAGVRYFHLTGRVIMSTTAGSVTFQWAQNTSDASDTKVLEGSLLLAWEE